MGLPITQLAKQFAGLGFNLASDLVNASSGVVTPTLAEKTVSAMVLKFSQKDTDGNSIRIGDERVLIQSSQLKGIIPASDDVLDDGAGIVRKLLSFTLDASKTIYTFHARREVSA